MHTPTPLRILPDCSRRFGCKVYGKLEIYNFTGSHKDRESQEIIKYAVSAGVRKLAIASTGNAAISLAAYSYVHGLECHVHLPQGIALERLAQIQAYRPVIHVASTYREAFAECQEQCRREGMLDCNPGSRFEKLRGNSRLGAEIATRIKPGCMVCPTNNGTLLAGVWMGMKYRKLRPRMIAAVAKETRLAEGIAGFHRLEEPALSECLEESRGEVIEVTDPEIVEATRLLLKDGLIVEGAAAAAVASLNQLDLSSRSKVCCIITGSGLKFPNTIGELLRTGAV